MKTYLARSWINPKLVPGTSKIHGVGVIAAAPVGRGEKLMEFGGDAITAEGVESELYRSRSVWIVRDDFYLGLLESDTEPSLDENLNHSCDANSWLTDEVTLVAKTDIQAGEEITLDQGTWNFDEDEYVWDQDACSCGAARCRKILTKDDWMLADVRARYKGHFHPMLQQRIDTQAEAERLVNT